MSQPVHRKMVSGDAFLSTCPFNFVSAPGFDLAICMAAFVRGSTFFLRGALVSPGSSISTSHSCPYRSVSTKAREDPSPFSFPRFFFLAILKQNTEKRKRDGVAKKKEDKKEFSWEIQRRKKPKMA